VFGVESHQWGETPVAAVLLKAEFHVTAQALKEWANERVEARFQKISDLIIVDSMPRNAAGKTLKNELKDHYLADQTKEQS
jgi:acyl-CoA synthetase (AMP-forming)/AMP-acid ligase II